MIMAKDKDSMVKMKANDAKIVRKIVLIIFVSFTLIISVGIFSSYFYIKTALEPVEVDSSEEIEVEIPLGSSTNEIGRILEKNGVIKNSKVFRFYTKFKNYSNFQAGNYSLSPSLTLNEIMEELQSGKVIQEPMHRITIPEGKTAEQIASIFANKLPFSEDDFINDVNDKAVIKDLMERYPDLLTDEILNSELYM